MAGRSSGPDGRILNEGFIEEIGEHKRMQESLRKSEERFATAFLSSPAITALFGPDDDGNRYLEVNGTFEQITGYRRDEVIGKSWAELGLWADPSSREEAVRHLVNEKSLRNWEFSFRKKNGELGTGLLSADLIEIHGKSVCDHRNGGHH